MNENIKQGIMVVLLLFVGGVVLAIVDPSGILWERLWKLVTSLLELADKYPYLSNTLASYGEESSTLIG